VGFQVEDDPDPLDVEFLETQIRREAPAAMGLDDEVRGVATRLIAAGETEAAARGCAQTVHFTYDFQARGL
jgi:hypothetical protein